MGKGTRKIILPAGIASFLAVLIAWVLTHLGGGFGSGSGSDTQHSVPASQPAPAQPGGAMQVVVSGDRYLVEEKDVSIEQAVGMAKDAAAVRIVSGPDSRMGAKLNLEKAMDAAHVTYTLETSPVPEQ